jgi:hypothetical protein
MNSEVESFQERGRGVARGGMCVDELWVSMGVLVLHRNGTIPRHQMMQQRKEE